jgi:hypothetical protein
LKLRARDSWQRAFHCAGVIAFPVYLSEGFVRLMMSSTGKVFWSSATSCPS